MASPPEITSKTQIWRMKVQPLRDALEARGLDSTRDQMELKRRLKFAIFPDNSSQSQSNDSNVARNSSQPNVSNAANILASSQANV